MTPFLDLLKKFPTPPPIVKVIGLKDLQSIMAGLQTNDKSFGDYLLGGKGKGGYDTPKIAAALIKLARLPFERSEMIIQIDDDVKPNAIGILNLKERYYELIHRGGNKKFCMSWNYNAIRIESGIDPIKGPHYVALFSYLVNSFSIRSTFLSEPSVRCRIMDDETISFQDVDNAPVSLDVIRTKYFLDLFKTGAWGSDLADPISGAGMVYSSDSLRELPPWTNSDELISWIDDFNKWLLMETYYGRNFRSDIGLLIRESGRGFPQERNHPSDFRIKDVKWSVNIYLDRLLMGCLLCFAVKPQQYNPHISKGFGHLLREKDYNLVRMRWNTLRDKLEEGMTEHVTKVLQDWLHYFCQQADSGNPGYITSPQRPPDGFTKAPPDTPFNTYTIKQLNQLENGSFDLVEKVLTVLDRYLELKYEFWHQIVKRLERIQMEHAKSNHSSAAPYDWLFEGLSNVKETPPMPTRESVASYSLIKSPDCPEDKPMYLLQWNTKWEKMNLISGHQDPDDPNELTCIIREMHEELFKSLETEKLTAMRNALQAKKDYKRQRDTADWNDPWIESVNRHQRNTIEYVAFSGSAKEWTAYKMTVFNVVLQPSDDNQQPLKLFTDDPFFSPTTRTSPKSANEWVSSEDIKKGFTRIGRPISPTVKRIFLECGII